MKRKPLSFSQHLFFSVIAIYCIFVASFLCYQYRREKTHKVELLNTTLSMFNVDLYDHMADTAFSVKDYVARYRMRHHLRKLRVTLVDRHGNVIFDNDISSGHVKDNHLDREEIREALAAGSGYSIKRISDTLGEEFFYSANYFPEKELFVRSALPYDTDLIAMLNADKGYLWFSFLLSAILSLVFYDLTARLGAMITQLRLFARRADQDEAVDTNDLKGLGNSDLGQISRHIVDIYTRLRKAKDDLFREREKLITHLQISNEGLAVFNPGKDVVLANGLFMQYVNLISDKNIGRVEDVFQVRELQPLFDFIAMSRKSLTRGELRQKLLAVDKNGYVFKLSVALFVDNSFEVSISDITKQEEQARMKRQITQNIAHELKTPVSSIQGYLETVLNNPGLPPDLLKKFLERSFAQSNRLTSLLRDISALTRMTEAAQMIEVTDVDLASMIRNMVAELALKLEGKQMTVGISVPDKLVVQGNSSLLYSIFRNLMDNAIAYAGSGTHVGIVCYSEDEDAYYFSVSDNGVGVSSDHLGRIFERFYRVDKGRSRKSGGTGLGLAIVKNAVLFHGGNINAKPSGGGHGLEFLFTLKKKKL